jgi:hypothetical protein
VGFGSGIYGEKHHKQLLKLAEALPKVKKKKAFLFSTSGVPKIGWSEEKVAKDHKKLREKLESKGYQIIDEFGCIVSPSSLGASTRADRTRKTSRMPGSSPVD